MKRIIFWLIILSSLRGLSQTTKLDSLELLLAQSTEDTTRLRLLNKVVMLIYQSDFPKTIKYSTEALSIAQKIGNADQEMKAHYFIGVGHLLSSNKIDASYHVKKALEIATKKLSDQNGMMDCHNLLGTISKESNDIDAALYHYFESAKLAKEHDNPGRLATAYGNIGDIYKANQELAKAETYYSDALDIFVAEEDFFFAAFIYNNLATISESPDSSLVMLDKAIKVFEKENYLDGVAQSCINIAAEYKNLEEYDKALPYLERARDIFESEKLYYKPGLTSVYMNMGIVNGKLGKAATAQKWFDKSIALAKEIEHIVYLKDIYENYSAFFENNNNTREALQYFKLAAELKDSLFNESKAKELAESETRFQTELKEAALSQKELEFEIQSKQKNRILFGGIFLLILLSALFLFLRYRQRQKRKQAELELKLEKAEVDKLRDLDNAKSNFFANISHEFRTPLTLILGPLRQMRDGSFKGNLQKYQDIMIRNGERLMRLVNQLLDLSKLESGSMELNLSHSDLIKTVRAIAHLFESLAERKEIHFEIDLPNESIKANYDIDKLEKILTNLLSNAFKYTSEGGEVKIKMDIISDNSPKSENFAVICVKDTGMGISEEDLPHIFERFFQTSNRSDLQASSGIGLALTKELVELQRGTIDAKSELNNHTVFTIKIPIGEISRTSISAQNDSAQKSESTIILPASVAVSATSVSESSKPTADSPLLLLVEDNEDVRTYIRDLLKTDFRILEAVDGSEGFKNAIEATPDLIISDVMMPKMNGIEMCKALKNDDKTSHIPIILLTAKAEQEDKIEGLQTGADDYLKKPFDAAELKIRVKNLIEQRHRLQKKFGQNFEFQPKSLNINSLDEYFLNKVKHSIEENLDDETFSVVELSHIMNMSRSQLHRKLKSMTDQSPNQIIRSMRLLRAKELLEKKAGNASQVAYMAGFNSPAYFSKCYRDHFGISPSEVQ